MSPDDVFRAAQPLLRDFAPLFDRMRIRGEQRRIDSMTGELARKYDLNPQQQEALKEWFAKKTEADAKHWSDLVGRDGTTLEDLARASQNVRPDEGLDGFMEKTLSGDKLSEFKTERMAERAQRVQQDADMQVQRLDGIVDLDETQRDQVFGIMARGSKDYDPTMKLEGVSSSLGPAPSGSRNEAVLGVLRPEQRAAYDAERNRRRDEARKNMESMGLTLPPTWNLLDQNELD